MNENRTIQICVSSEFFETLKNYCRQNDKAVSEEIKRLIQGGLSAERDSYPLKRLGSTLYGRPPKAGRPKLNRFDPEFEELCDKVKEMRDARYPVRQIAEAYGESKYKIRRICRYLDQCAASTELGRKARAGLADPFEADWVVKHVTY